MIHKRNYFQICI